MLLVKSIAGTDVVGGGVGGEAGVDADMGVFKRVTGAAAEIWFNRRFKLTEPPS